MDSRVGGLMAKIDSWLEEWAESVIEETYKSNYSGINSVERILRDPGVATAQGAHRVLWWPKNPRVAKISKAAHQLTPIEIVCLLVKYGHVMDDNQNRFTPEHLATHSSIGLRRFKSIIKQARAKLIEITRCYAKMQ
jgi:hypothetical protein